MSTNQEQEPSEEHLLLHAYDGIQEYDHPMPGWWVWLYWASFWFSLAYLFHYWLGSGESVQASYEQEVTVVLEAEAKAAMGEEISEGALSTVMADAASVEAGRALFIARCSACHLERGQGQIGPNLTDLYWIHGSGQLLELFHTVSDGVPAKGMPAWNRQLSPSELRQVVAFVGTLRGSAVLGKAPEGQLVR